MTEIDDLFAEAERAKKEDKPKPIKAEPKEEPEPLPVKPPNITKESIKEIYRQNRERQKIIKEIKARLKELKAIQKKQRAVAREMKKALL